MSSKDNGSKFAQFQVTALGLRLGNRKEKFLRETSELMDWAMETMAEQQREVERLQALVRDNWLHEEQCNWNGTKCHCGMEEALREKA